MQDWREHRRPRRSWREGYSPALPVFQPSEPQPSLESHSLAATLLPCPHPAHSLIVAVGSCEHPLGVHQDAPTLEFGVVVHGCHPGLRILLTGKSSDDPRLDGRCSTCGRAVGVGLAQRGRCAAEGHRAGIRGHLREGTHKWLALGKEISAVGIEIT